MTQPQYQNLSADNPTMQSITPKQSKDICDNIRRIALQAIRDTYTPHGDARVPVEATFDDMVEEVNTKVESLRQELQYEEANALDKIVIEQILNAWVQFYVASWLQGAETPDNRSWRQNHYFHLRFQQCQTRLTKALDQLTKIRQIKEELLILESKAVREDRLARQRAQQISHDDKYLPKLKKARSK